MVVDGGPGVTGHITPPNLVSLSNPPGLALSVSLPEPATLFGYGYALLSFGNVPAATTMDVFDGANLLGSISFTAEPDPIFAGGLAGVKSDSPFDRIVITFSQNASAFALDNIRFGQVDNVPEGGASGVLLAFGLLILAIARWASSMRRPLIN